MSVHGDASHSPALDDGAAADMDPDTAAEAATGLSRAELAALTVEDPREAARRTKRAAAVQRVTEKVLDARAQISHWQAVESAALAEAGELAVGAPGPDALFPQNEHDMVLRSIAAHIAAAACVSDRTVQRRIGDARTLDENFPATVTAWRDGLISAQHVSVILDTGMQVEDGVARARLDELAARLAQREAPGRVRTALTRIAEEEQPRSLAERHALAREGRCVRLVPGGDGMAQLIADLPAVLAKASYDRLTRQARMLARAVDASGADTSGAHGSDADRDRSDEDIADGRATDTRDADRGTPDDEAVVPDTRTMDQRRADIFADMLLTATPTFDPAAGSAGGLGAVRALVQVTVPLAALDPPDDGDTLDPIGEAARHDDAALGNTTLHDAMPERTASAGGRSPVAELAGYGPIDLDTARQLAAGEPGWDRVFHDARTGQVLAVDRYRPSARMERFLRARDRRCRFPGCQQPAHRCDIDHTVDWARGGRTALDNLAHLCRRHHSLKQAAPAWTLTQRGDGVLEWHSPFGQTYVDVPPNMVRFDADDPPF